MVVVAKQSSRHNMWIEITRRKYERGRQRYASDLTDAEWALIERSCRQPSVWARRARPNCTAYSARSFTSRGAAVSGECLLKEFPPFTTVRGYFYDWRDNSCLRPSIFTAAASARSRERADGNHRQSIGQDDRRWRAARWSL